MLRGETIAPCLSFLEVKRSSRGPVDQLFTLARLLGGGLGSLPNQSTCALWTWRRRSTGFLCAGCWTRCSGPSGLCRTAVGDVFVSSSKRHTRSRTGGLPQWGRDGSGGRQADRAAGRESRPSTYWPLGSDRKSEVVE